MLFNGCCAVRLTPAVCVWKRSVQARGLVALKRSRITLYQMRRAARYLAISSKKSLCALKKKLRRGANSFTSMPALMETGLKRGISFVQNSIVSVISFIEGRGG